MMKMGDQSREAHRAFYDRFLHSRMLAYRVYGNRRIDLAFSRIRPFLSREMNVLEIGCGIGIISERIARRVRHGRVWACDLSPANIAFARRTVIRDNVEFFVCDVLDEFGDVLKRTRAVDLVVMVDVLEHLPSDRHEELFSRLGELLTSSSTVIVTAPSAEYQEHLRRMEPEKLQPIDESIGPCDMERLARYAGLHLSLFQKVDVWRRGQYVHFIMGREDSYLEEIRPSVLRRGLMKLARLAQTTLTRPLLMRRYRKIMQDIEQDRA